MRCCEGSDVGVIKGPGPDGLVEQAVGWPIPVAELVYWIRGLLPPHKRCRHRVCPGRHPGRRLSPRPGCWSFNVMSTRRMCCLPARLEATSSSYRVRIVLRQWQLGVSTLKQTRYNAFPIGPWSCLILAGLRSVTAAGTSPSWLRHGVLIPAFAGSSPAVPANFSYRSAKKQSGDSVTQSSLDGLFRNRQSGPCAIHCRMSRCADGTGQCRAIQRWRSDGGNHGERPRTGHLPDSANLSADGRKLHGAGGHDRLRSNAPRPLV